MKRLCLILSLECCCKHNKEQIFERTCSLAHVLILTDLSGPALSGSVSTAFRPGVLTSGCCDNRGPAELMVGGLRLTETALDNTSD